MSRKSLGLVQITLFALPPYKWTEAGIYSSVYGLIEATDAAASFDSDSQKSTANMLWCHYRRACVVSGPRPWVDNQKLDP